MIRAPIVVQTTNLVIMMNQLEASIKELLVTRIQMMKTRKITMRKIN